MTPSVILIVKDDPRIDMTLTALARQSAATHAEVIVVDASRGRLDHIAERHPSVRWLTFTPVSTGSSIPQQRNAGLVAATGDRLVFLDADCAPGPNWLAALLRAFDEGEHAVAGTILSAGYRGVRDPSRRYVTKWGNGNLAFTRGVYDAVGPYDEKLTVAEDYDYCLRIGRAGYRIRFVPEATVDHPDGRFADNLRKAVRYGRGAVRLYRRHPRALADRSDLHGVYTIVYAGFVAGLVLIRRWPWYPALVLLPAVLSRRPVSLRKELLNVAHGAGSLMELATMVIRAVRRTT